MLAASNLTGGATRNLIVVDILIRTMACNVTAQPSTPGGRAASELSDLSSAVDSLDDDKNRDMKKWCKAKRIEILITGKTGVGKSTLVNGLVGRKVAKEGRNLRPETMGVTDYQLTTAQGLEIIVWDSPGLQDGTGNEAAYLAEMKEKCSEVDIVICCISLDPRAKLGEEQTDFKAIKKLTETFGPEWWKYSVFVMTFGNMLESMVKTKYHQKAAVEDKFNANIESWKQRIHQALSSAGVPEKIVSQVPVEVAGYFRKPHLPGREYWFSKLWLTIADRIKPKSQPAFVKINEKRFRKSSEVRPSDITSTQGHEQPIVIDRIISVVKMAFEGMVIGARLGARVKGTAGACVGGAVGGTLGAALGLLQYLWERQE